MIKIEFGLKTQIGLKRIKNVKVSLFNVSVYNFTILLTKKK